MEIKKFVRQDAKYACAHCKAKFFTRDEVEACFDGHGQEAIDAAEARAASKGQKKGA